MACSAIVLGLRFRASCENERGTMTEGAQSQESHKGRGREGHKQGKFTHICSQLSFSLDLFSERIDWVQDENFDSESAHKFCKLTQVQHFGV